MEQIIEERIEKVFENIQNLRNPEALFIYNRDRVDKNFMYLTGHHQGVFENCGVLCERGGKMFIFTTTLEEEILREEEGFAEIIVYKSERERNDGLKKVLSNYKTLGICFRSISHSLYLDFQGLLKSTELVDIGRAFAIARMIKTPDEVEKIAEASRIASRTADELPEFMREGVTELELSAEIDYRMNKSGAHGAAFKTIVAFAANTSKPHYDGEWVPLKNGDVVLADFGARFMGYVSDITRTYLTGKPDEALLKLYRTVRRAQEIALDLIAEGVSTELVENEVKNYINSVDGYGGHFIHGLGHSIGLDTHDNGYPGADFDHKFAANMVLTVEPGIYLPGLYGVRIEDDIVVKDDSCKILTTARKEPQAYEV